jgi:hypothetical protein
MVPPSQRSPEQVSLGSFPPNRTKYLPLPLKVCGLLVGSISERKRKLGVISSELFFLWK